MIDADAIQYCRDTVGRKLDERAGDCSRQRMGRPDLSLRMSRKLHARGLVRNKRNRNPQRDRRTHMKLIHITDTHFVARGLKLYGLDPYVRLAAAIVDINTHHRDAELAIITGDLTHWGEPAAYASFLDCMSQLAIPYVPLVGNHDRRETCLEALTAAPRDEHGFVQGYRDASRGRLIFLDTLEHGTHAGHMCGKRLGWLARTLDETPRNKPIFLFMHHPPFDVGIDVMDRIALIERDQFEAIIRPYHGRIRHLFHGHVHRPICGSWIGLPFSTLRGINHQVWFDLDPTSPHLASQEPAAYGVVLVGDTTVIVHTHDYMDASPRFPFAKPGVDDRTYVLGEM
jgi:3',5'-cyclic-AMP phosphodiesterase